VQRGESEQKPRGGLRTRRGIEPGQPEKPKERLKPEISNAEKQSGVCKRRHTRRLDLLKGTLTPRPGEPWNQKEKNGLPSKKKKKKNKARSGEKNHGAGKRENNEARKEGKRSPSFSRSGKSASQERKVTEKMGTPTNVQIREKGNAENNKTRQHEDAAEQRNREQQIVSPKRRERGCRLRKGSEKMQERRISGKKKNVNAGGKGRGKKRFPQGRPSKPQKARLGKGNSS